jgi:hypothetical protein
MFADADVRYFEYDSTIFGRGVGLQTLANRFADIVLDYPLQLGEYDQIVFVTHSLGGLVVRQAILDSEVLRAKTRAIFSFAAPMSGSWAASVASQIGGGRDVRDLVNGISNKVLERLSDGWRNRQLARTIWS